jgi:hypothetical protein
MTWLLPESPYCRMLSCELRREVKKGSNKFSAQEGKKGSGQDAKGGV